MPSFSLTLGWANWRVEAQVQLALSSFIPVSTDGQFFRTVFINRSSASYRRNANEKVPGAEGENSLSARLREIIHCTVRQGLWIIAVVGPAISYRTGSENTTVPPSRGWLVKYCRYLQTALKQDSNAKPCSYENPCSTMRKILKGKVLVTDLGQEQAV